MLQRGLWHPIGHVSEVLRETGLCRSGFSSYLPLRQAYAGMVSLCLCAHLQMHCMSLHVHVHAHAYICASDQVFQRPRCCAVEIGSWQCAAKKWCRVHRRCRVSATQDMSCCPFLSIVPLTANENRCTPAQEQCGPMQ